MDCCKQREALPLLAGPKGRSLMLLRLATFASICFWFGFALVEAHAANIDPTRIPPAAGQPVDFARDIMPMFEASCIKCHGAEKAKNGFRLDSRARAIAGGDNGIDIIPGDSAKSPLVHHVAGLIADAE